MKTKIVNEMFNMLINTDLWCGHLFLTMYTIAEGKGYKGFAHWLYARYYDRIARSKKLMNFQHSKKIEVSIRQIDNMQSNFGNIVEMLDFLVEQEERIETMMYVVGIEIKEHGDKESYDMLMSHIDDQLNEIKKAKKVFKAVKAAKGNDAKIQEIDDKLGKQKIPEPFF